MRFCALLAAAVLIVPLLLVLLGAMALSGTVFERANSRRGAYVPKITH